MKKIRYGVIGIKGIGNIHCNLAKENEKIELTALVDEDEAALKQKSKEFGVLGFTDYREMLYNDIVDAVSIATPHHLHASMGLDCLNAGVHTFVEKPIAIRVSEADKMIDMAIRKDLKLCVGHQYRTYRTSQTMKNIIETGEIGNIMRVLWSWYMFRPQIYFKKNPWKSRWKTSGGGISIYNIIHDLDLLCWIIGKPVQVSAFLGNQFHDTEVDDIMGANILFENGAFCSIQSSLNQSPEYSVRQIAGEKGIIVIQDAKSLTFDRKDRILIGTYKDPLPFFDSKAKGIMDQPKTVWRSARIIGDTPRWKKLLQLAGLMKGRPHGHYFLMASFIEAILNGGEPMVNGKSALQSLELVNAIILSAVQKKAIDLPLDRKIYDTFFDEMCTGNIQIPKFRRSHRD